MTFLKEVKPLSWKIPVMLAIGYLLGSIPSGVIIGKVFYGKDIRKYGSKNMGTTNTFRVLGKTSGIIVFLMDTLKGVLAALLPYFFHSNANPMLIALSAIIGHAFPIFVGFKGGKAVATSAGALLVYNWRFCLIAWVIFITSILLTSMVSVGSMAGFVMVTIAAIFFKDPVLIFISLGLTIFVFIRHWKNIERIKNGTESMVPFGLGYWLRQRRLKVQKASKDSHSKN